MKIKSVLSTVAVAAAVVAGAAHAAPVTVGGVTWDPADPIDTFATSTLYERVVTTAGEELRGYGKINTINGLETFCSGCQLTYTFEGYILQNNIPATGGAFSFSGGVFNFYVDSSTPSVLGNVASYSDGLLWLSAVGADPLGLGGTLIGSTTLPVGATQISGAGAGYLDVNLVGAAAEAYFDTNSIFGSDFLFTSSFQPLRTALSDGMTYSGTAEVQGDSVAVPEPGVLALLGLGFAGLGFARRSKKSA